LVVDDRAKIDVARSVSAAIRSNTWAAAGLAISSEMAVANK
jgi:hypothetical protein